LRDALKPFRKNAGLVFPSTRTGKERLGIQKAFKSAIHRAGKRFDEASGKWIKTENGVTLDGLELHVYAMRRTRISIWDPIDSDACRFAVGHVGRDVHSRHYLKITTERLFKLVGIVYNPALQFRILSKVG
jgi:hypothetical protein